MSLRKAYVLTLMVKSPFMFAGNVNTRIGVDVACLRDPKGRPVIPDSQIRGVLRAAMQELENVTDLVDDGVVDILFGKESHSEKGGEQDIPNRGRAIFGDLAGDHTGGGSLTRIAIDDETGSVKKGALQIVELAAPLGLPVRFSGRLIIRYSERLDPARIEKAIAAALRLVPSIGAFKSAGFGEVISAECSLSPDGKETALLPASPQSIDGAKRYRLDLTFDRAILVNSRRVTDNLFAGSKIIPGSVLKGALAEQLKIGGRNPETESELGAALSRLRFSHAFPCKGEDVLELPIPRSLVLDASSLTVADAIRLQSGRGIIWRDSGEPAKFAISSKQRDKDNFRKAGLLPRIATMEEVSRTHVKIDPQEWTAETGKLYTTVALEPGDHVWRTHVDFGEMASAKDAGLLLAMLVNGLDGIGRTGASAKVGIAPAPWEEPEFQPGETIAFTLNTPALMFLKFGRADTLRLKYQHYFDKHLGAELINFHASVSMVGNYLATRRRLFAETYYPFMVTDPGSVFLIRLKDEAAASAANRALRFGLPVADEPGMEPSWRNCPFLPENGFGEIALGTGQGRKPAPDNSEMLEAVGDVDVR